MQQDVPWYWISSYSVCMYVRSGIEATTDTITNAPESLALKLASDLLLGWELTAQSPQHHSSNYIVIFIARSRCLEVTENLQDRAEKPSS